MREKKIYCGKHYREVDIYPYTAAQLTASTRGKRSKKIKETEPKQKNLNDKNARRYFTQTANLNFGSDPEALHVTATYSGKYLPDTVEQAEQEATNFLRRVQYRRKKEGLPPLKYMIVTAYTTKRNSETPVRIYIGGGKVIECSPAFKNCVQVTACLNIGAISGMNGRKWTKHGKLPYITYDTAGGAQNGAGSTTKPSGTTTTPAALTFAVGDVVRFTGNTHYTNAAAASGAVCKPGTAKVTALAKGAKHPYHLIKQPGGGSTVYGWVNAADVQAVGSGTTAPKMRVGAKVKYSGPLYRDSNGGGQGKTVNGTYTVKYYYPARKCGVHIDGLGWVPESGCTVIG